MLRLRALILIYLSYYVGWQASGVETADYLSQITLSIFALALWYLNGTCVNDLADIAIDRINLKNALSRPLANNLTSSNTLKAIAVASGIISILCAYAISESAAIILLGAIVLNYLYSMPPIRISYRGVWAPLLLPLGYVLLPYLLAFYSSGSPYDGFSLMLVTGMYLCFIGRIVLKDIRDIKGDTRFGKKTFVIRHGLENTLIFSGAFFVVGTLILSALFLKINILLSIALLLQMVVVVFVLEKMRTAKGRDRQQIILGVISQIATAGLLCVAVALDENVRTGLQSFLILAISIYGTFFGLYILYNPQFKRISY